MDLGYAVRADFDDNGVRVRISGSLWKLKKSLFGKPIWKRRWVSCDGAIVIVWNLPTKDERGAIPKYKFKLDSCTIETDVTGTAERQNMFRLTDSSTNGSLSLATDTPELLETWVDFLTSDKDYDELVRDVEFKKRLEEEKLKALHKLNSEESDDDDDDDEYDEVSEGGKLLRDVDSQNPNQTESSSHEHKNEGIGQKSPTKQLSLKKRQQLKALADKSLGEKIVTFFLEHDVSASSALPVIKSDALPALMHMIDSSYHELVLKVAMQDMQSNQYIAMPDFLEWFSHYEMRAGLHLEQSSAPVDKNVETIMTAAHRREIVAVDPILLAAKDYGQRQKFNFCSYPDTTARGVEACLAGVLDPELRCPLRKSVCAKTLVETLVPPIHRLVLLENENKVKFQEDEHHVVSYEWNDLYQQLLDEASNVYVHPNNFAKESQSQNLENCCQNITASLNLAAFQAEFIKTAIEGARIIVDEYSLPEQFKTIHSIDKRTLQRKKENEKSPMIKYQQYDQDVEKVYSNQLIPDGAYESASTNTTPQSDRSKKVKTVHKSHEEDDIFHQITKDIDDDDDLQSEHFSVHTPTGSVRGRKTGDMQKFQVETTEMGHEEMFGYHGLLCRIIAHGVEEHLDADPSDARVQTLGVIDAALHKEAGHEHRGLLFMKNASDSAYAEQLDSFVNNHTEGNSKPNVASARTVLATIVDYAGFRVSVTCPVDVNEDSTLVHGFSSALSEDNASVASAHPDSGRLFVDAHAPLRRVLPRLAHHLNLALANRDCMVSTTTLESAKTTNGNMPATIQEVETISRKLEAHSVQGQIYFLNCAGLLVPDLPRSETNDLEIRRMRPEFVRNYAQSLSPDAYADGEQLDKPTSTDGSVSVSGMATESGVNVQLDRVLKATRHMYTSVLPELACALDTMATLPLDSAELTQVFHSYGASMRHMGAVFVVSKSRHTHQLLVVEAVARSCKVLLSNMLKSNARKGKAQTMSAELRQRSTREDYMEHMAHLHGGRQESILRLFNLVLGTSKASTQLWSTVLADIVFQKFAITLPTVNGNISKYQVLHVPQLFLAMQYHLGVQFADHCEYHLDGSAEDCVLQHADILNYHVPKAKPLSCAQNRSLSAGYAGHLDTLAASFLASGIHEEACYLLRLRLSLQLTNNQHSSSGADTAGYVRAAYLLAVGLFHSGKYLEAMQTIQAQLDHGLKYSAMGGRLYMLLMCCYCREQNGALLNKAVVAFDAAKAIFSYLLGEHHPIQAILMCALADQYVHLKHFKHAVALLTGAVQFASHNFEDRAQLVTAGYQVKLAQLHIRMYDDNEVSGHRTQAVDYLTEALSIYDGLSRDGAAVTDETIDCLYGLTLLYKQMGRLEDALLTATRCRTVTMSRYAVKAYTKSKLHLPSPELMLMPPPAASCLLLLGDLLMATQHGELAIEVLIQVWNAVRRAPSYYSSIGDIYMSLTRRMLAALYSQLPFPTRSLLTTIASEVEARSHPQHGIEIPGAWTKAQETVFESMWLNDPRAYFASVVDGVMRGEIEGNKPTDRADFELLSTPVAISSTSKRGGEKQHVSGPVTETTLTHGLNIFALQAAVIVRLIRKDGQE